MRLVQLSRKLGITQSEIIKFLSKKGILNIEGSNAKIDDRALAVVMEHFGKSSDITIENADEDSAEKPVQVKAVETKKTYHQEDKQTAIASDKQETEEIVQAEANLPDEKPAQKLAENRAPEPGEVEVIRAKKIKLEGIKVLGKIDLPEPVKKEKDEAPEKSITERKTRQKRNTGETNSKKNYRKPKRQETFEQRQKRQEREAQRKKKEREKKLKKKKKEYYEQLVKSEQNKPKAVAKPRKKKKKVTEASIVKKKVVYHKNPIIRLWAWLNGRYD
ncbi:hypothetical protein LVD17_23635 [Fulvivirga ulvae]|uniref:hypothetical protein n=1 Tax=Fulvivirga ulvae TaxID=2904245 RepID=UPI001F3AAF8C|nr:hypothetical protein [Fulvivirga ulvae]UII31288.1 hypothetical protein LVD17_23635 [Fulvivirga ulvae]